MSVGIIWLQDDTGIAGQVGAFINVRSSPGVWARTMLYDYLANPPAGVDPATTALTNLSANLRTTQALTDLGTIFGVTGLLAFPHQNYPVAFPEVTPTAATELDATNNSCVDFNYQLGAVPQGAWKVGGVWWTVMQLPAAFQLDGLDHIRVYKSTDYVTWTGVDTANEITPNQASAWYFDGTGTIYFCYDDALGNINLIEFSLTTQLWGVVHGTTATTLNPYTMVYSTSAGLWHVVFSNAINQPVYGYSDGTNWTFPAITIPQGNWTSIASYMLLDPNGTTVHIVAGTQYSQVQAGGVLGPTSNFNLLLSMTFGGRGTITDNTLFFPTTNNATGELYCIVSSGPLSNPTFAAELVDSAFRSSGGVAEESVSIIVDASATLTLTKTVTAGGGRVPTDFTVTATGPSTISGAGGVGPASVTPGTYALSESTVAGYQSRGWVCVGGTQVGDNITLAPGDVVVCSIINDPITLLSNGGGRGFIHVTPNVFDSCLGREYLLYKQIDRELLKCGVKPFCFCFDERDWGGNFSEHEEVPMGPPEGAIAFNPTGQLLLPTTASGDNVIFQTRVPIGYDGVILGQYHGYIPDPTAFPVPNFVEGGGDIVWRLEAAGRCMRDCGIMKVSIGSLKNMAPVAGGLQVRSGDLIQYVVAVPNTSGALTPGVGYIVAGLHGYYWPRK